MSECDNCGRGGLIGTFDGLCNPCWTETREGTKRVPGHGTDWHEANPEAAAHRAARDRKRVLGER